MSVDVVLLVVSLLVVVECAGDAVAGRGQLEGLHLEGVVVVLRVVHQQAVVGVFLHAFARVAL